MSKPPDDTRDRIVRVCRLLKQASLPTSFSLIPLQGGANSKAFRVGLPARHAPLFFKEYFHHPDDNRDRIGTEFAFASFAWEHGLRVIAEPHAMDRESRGALFAHIEGRKLTPREISREAVDQALRFFRDLNEHRSSARAAALPTASEACFSLEDHWRCLARRIDRLQSVEPTQGIDREALAFVQRDLTPACAAHLGSARDLAAAVGIRPEALLPQEDWCLSPSDFGFHNALLGDDETLRFLDFEYAGWDDPAKLVCDFFCQPACPVPMHYYADFASAVAFATSDPPLHRLRMDLLLPMYRLKWCCILLNEFQPAGASRRRFAFQDRTELSRRTEQLQKARQALQRYWNVEPAAAAA